MNKKGKTPVKNEGVKSPSEPLHTTAVVVGAVNKPEKKLAKFFRGIPKSVAIGVPLLIVILGGLVAYDILAPHNIIIGNTTITKADIKRYSDEVTTYSKSHGVNFGGPSQKVAQNDLILNAALKDQAVLYHVSVNQSDIDANLASQYKYYGSKGAYQSYTKANGINYVTNIRSENTEYENKLESLVLAKKDIFMVGITYDAPFFNKSKDSAALRAQATNILQSKFLPLFKAGESEAQIAAQTQVNLSAPDPNLDRSIFFNSMPTMSATASGCTASEDCFNDISSGRFAKLPGIVSAKSKVAELTKVGQYTDVFTSQAGFIGIFQLKSQTSGSYSSWDQLTAAYKKKYAPQLATMENVQYHLGLTVSKLGKQIGQLVGPHGSLFGPRAYADTTCGGYPASDHYIHVDIKAKDAATGAGISGISLRESRSLSDCPNFYGAYIDDSGQPGHGPNIGSTNSNGLLDFYDSCWAANPYVHITNVPQGDTFAPQNDTGGNSFATFKYGTRVIPGISDSAMDNVIASMWTNGINSGAGLSINLYFHTQPTWHLDPTSSVSTTTLTDTQTATFSHSIKNKSGSDPASYDWYVQGEYKNSGGWSGWTENNCTVNAGVTLAGDKCPLASGSPSNVGAGKDSPSSWNIRYKFPSTAKDGDEYCQQIVIGHNAFGPKTGSLDSHTNQGQTFCVTLKKTGGPPPPKCKPCDPSCDPNRNGPTCKPQPSLSACYQTKVFAAATYAGSFGGSVYGNWSGRTRVFVNSRDPFGNVVPAVDGSNPGSTGYIRGDNQTHTFNYFPDGKGVTIVVINEAYAHHHDQYVVQAGYTDKQGKVHPPVYGYRDYDQWDNVNSSINAPDCYAATCTVTSVDGDGPTANSVLAGHQYTVNVSLTNTGNENLMQYAFLWGGPQLGVTGTGGDHPIGRGLSRGGSEDIAVTLTAPSTAGLQTSSFTPAYLGGQGFPLGGGCSGPTVDVYEPFNISLTASANLVPNQEDPTGGVNYRTTACNDASTGVDVPTFSQALKQSGGAFDTARTSPPPIPGRGCYSPLNGNRPAAAPSAGDKYCAQIDASYTSGLVGGYGSGDVQDASNSSSSGAQCDTVYNQPYTHFFGNDVSAGGGFKGSSCTSAGAIQTYVKDPVSGGMPPRGSGVQFGAQAQGFIQGLVSGSLRSSSPTAPAGLSFANSGIGGTDTNYPAANLGGKMGLSSYCLPDYFSGHPGTLTGGSPAVNTAGSQYFQTFPGNPVNITGGTISNTHNQVIYVKGDVFISGNIMYSPISRTSISDIPSFYLIASGNIYIAPNVTQLDGVYIAQPSAAPNSGKIDTCAGGSGSLGISAIFDNCKNQLVVNGSFVANKVLLNRSYGSLRYSQNGEYPLGGGPPAHTCARGNEGNSSQLDCAAEIFNFSPEQYLAQPQFPPSSSPKSGKYDYITSLSPVL